MNFTARFRKTKTSNPKRVSALDITMLAQTSAAILIAHNMDMIKLLTALIDDNKNITKKDIETCLAPFCKANFEVGVLLLTLYKAISEGGEIIDFERFTKGYSDQADKITKQFIDDIRGSAAYEELDCFTALLHKEWCSECNKNHTVPDSLDKEKLEKLAQRLFVGDTKDERKKLNLN